MLTPNILLAVPDTPDFAACAKFAIYLAKNLRARLTAVYVVNEKVVHDLLAEKIFVDPEAKDFKVSLEEQGAIFLENLGAMAEEKGVEFEGRLLRGVVHHEVIKAAREIAGGKVDGARLSAAVKDRL